MSEINSIPTRANNFMDLTGNKFGRLEVLGFFGRVGPEGNQSSAWTCICECGNQKVVLGKNLRRGTSQSCGCLQKELAAERLTKHGMSRSPEFESWRSMWDRCTNPKDLAYSRYKDKAPPDAWRSFEEFYRELGDKPGPDYTLDRVDNSKPYGPGNCRWADWHTQMRNRSVNVWVICQGLQMVLTDAAATLGVSLSEARRVCREVSRPLQEGKCTTLTTSA